VGSKKIEVIHIAFQYRWKATQGQMTNIIG
jgi:hypothetical protein